MRLKTKLSGEHRRWNSCRYQAEFCLPTLVSQGNVRNVIRLGQLHYSCFQYSWSLRRTRMCFHTCLCILSPSAPFYHEESSQISKVPWLYLKILQSSLSLEEVSLVAVAKAVIRHVHYFQKKRLKGKIFRLGFDVNLQRSPGSDNSTLEILEPTNVC